MSIKIEGEGSKENVFSDSDSGMPLWNGAPLLNLVYPVGSIYWSSNDTDPGTLFGGTWQQIKDRFVLAAGDSYTNGAIGGAATVTLTVSNMPSHTHSFTPSGTVSSHTHTGPSHSHDLKDGTANVSTSTSTSIYIKQYKNYNGNRRAGNHLDAVTYDNRGTGNHLDAVTYDNRGTISITASSRSTSTISGSTEAAGTGNTGSTAPSFTGTAGNTDSSGSGSSFSILPPYVVKYCWERTA